MTHRGKLWIECRVRTFKWKRFISNRMPLYCTTRLRGVRRGKGKADNHDFNGAKYGNFTGGWGCVCHASRGEIGWLTRMFIYFPTPPCSLPHLKALLSKTFIWELLSADPNVCTEACCDVGVQGMVSVVVLSTSLGCDPRSRPGKCRNRFFYG